MENKIKQISEYALEALTKAGAQKASCSAERGRTDELNVEANQFSLLRTLFEDNITLKAIVDGKKGTTTLNKLDKESIDQAVVDCIALAASGSVDEAEDIAPKVINQDFDQSIGGSDMEQLFDRTQEFVRQTKAEYPKIILENVITRFKANEQVYMNSNGVVFSKIDEYYDMDSMFSAKEGEVSSSFNHYSLRTKSLASPFMEIGLLRNILADSEKSLHTRMVEGKFEGKIILAPTCVDMVWYTLLQSFLGDYAMISDTSRWKDALGTKVADPKLTLKASPLHPNIIGGECFTGDGFASHNFDLIREGVLNSFALSLYGANKTGKERALNTGFYNVEVAAGDTPLAEMIKGVDKGIYLGRFSGASPGASGDISGIAKNSFLIENGQITDAVGETMLSFNILDALNNIVAISSERSSDGHTVLPWCCFDGITISGK